MIQFQDQWKCFPIFSLLFFVEILNKIPDFLEYLWTEAAPLALELGGLWGGGGKKVMRNIPSHLEHSRNRDFHI